MRLSTSVDATVEQVVVGCQIQIVKQNDGQQQCAMAICHLARYIY